MRVLVPNVFTCAFEPEHSGASLRERGHWFVLVASCREQDETSRDQRDRPNEIEIDPGAA